MRKRFGCIEQDQKPHWHNPCQDARPWIDLLKAGIKSSASLLVCSAATELTTFMRA